jgi:hypothetical protein
MKDFIPGILIGKIEVLLREKRKRYRKSLNKKRAS